MTLHNKKRIKHFGMLILLMISFSCAKPKKQASKSDKNLLVITDSITLKHPKNQYELPRFESYSASTNMYLTHSQHGDRLYVHDSLGEVISSVFLPSEGPFKIDQIINAVFDQDDIVVLTHSEIVRFSLTGEEISRCKLSARGMRIRGSDQSRFIPYKNVYFVALLDSKDQDFGFGSKAFVEQAVVIKVIDKKDCSCKHKISFPKESIYQQGVFQSTLYEPQISLDRIHQELEVVYPIEPYLYIYDLTTFNLKQQIPIPVVEQLDFPAKVLFGEVLTAHDPVVIRKFQVDNNKAQFVKLLHLGENTLIGYRKSKNTVVSTIYYSLLNQKGTMISSFLISPDNKYRSILSVKDEQTFFCYYNFDSLKVEPRGFPLYISRIVL